MVFETFMSCLDFSAFDFFLIVFITAFFRTERFRLIIIHVVFMMCRLSFMNGHLAIAVALVVCETG